MNYRPIIFMFCVLLYIPSLADNNTISDKEQLHTEVSMRMIGHQVLLSLGDSTSRVLPIEKEGDQYRIRFENKFGFNPENVALIIDSVITATQIATNYIVRFETCETNQTAHSYEVGISKKTNVLACGTRDQPMACYNLVITILDSETSAEKETGASDFASEHAAGDYDNIYRLLMLLFAVILILMGSIAFFLKRKSVSNIKKNTVAIGDFEFDKRKMQLRFKNETTELTSKESDLLQLLYDSANDTVERDTILKMVWEDEGDYVGRTLDVFISKLRKKLESDSKVRIANIRGVGYKLMIDI